MSLLYQTRPIRVIWYLEPGHCTTFAMVLTPHPHSHPSSDLIHVRSHDISNNLNPSHNSVNGNDDKKTYFKRNCIVRSKEFSNSFLLPATHLTTLTSPHIPHHTYITTQTSPHKHHHTYINTHTSLQTLSLKPPVITMVIIITFDPAPDSAVEIPATLRYKRPSRPQTLCRPIRLQILVRLFQRLNETLFNTHETIKGYY